MSERLTLQAIGVVRAPRVDLTDDQWGNVESEIVLDAAQFGEDALAGLTEFSHLDGSPYSPDFSATGRAFGIES